MPGAASGWERLRQPARSRYIGQVATGPQGSVANRDAGDVGALQRPAYRFGLIAVEACEAGPEQLPVTLGDDRLGKRIGLGEQASTAIRPKRYAGR